MTLSADEVGFADIATAVSENNAQVCIVFSLFIKCYHVSGIEQLQGVFFFNVSHCTGRARARCGPGRVHAAVTLCFLGRVLTFRTPA